MKKYCKPDLYFNYLELTDVLLGSGDDKENFGDLGDWTTDGNL